MVHFFAIITRYSTCLTKPLTSTNCTNVLSSCFDILISSFLSEKGLQLFEIKYCLTLLLPQSVQHLYACNSSHRTQSWGDLPCTNVEIQALKIKVKYISETLFLTMRFHCDIRNKHMKLRLSTFYLKLFFFRMIISRTVCISAI